MAGLLQLREFGVIARKEIEMKKIIGAVAAAELIALAVAPAAFAADMPTSYSPPQAAAPQDDSNGVRIGLLDCDVGGGVGYVFGSAKSVDCVFRPATGRDQPGRYAGTIRKVGVDLGFTTRSRMVWAVFAPTAGYHHGSLGGLYQGASAEATAGIGVGANIMYGGTKGSIQLQPVSLTGQIGLNVAATGTSMTLKSIN